MLRSFPMRYASKWEEAAAEVKDLGVRLCIVRLGVVLNAVAE